MRTPTKRTPKFWKQPNETIGKITYKSASVFGILELGRFECERSVWTQGDGFNM